MPSNAKHKILAMGLPSSGKTTFLAALYAVIESKEIDTRLTLQQSGENDRHLNKIREKWTQCEPVPRNDPGTQEVVPLSIGATDGKQIDLTFPDLNGETFRDQWLDRTTTSVQQPISQSANSILLFIHPDIVEPWQIRDVQKIEAALGEIEGEPNNGDLKPESSEAEKPREWDARKAPTQVILVEVLQFALEEMSRAGHQRIAIIVSAWDLVRGEYDSADDWLQKRVPLLFQFLQSNEQEHPWRAYGVSAIGGNLKEEREELLKKDRCERIFITGEGVLNEHDIAEPIRWLIS